MFAQHTQTVERALWSAVRILEERSMLARRLAERACERQHALAAKQFQERADDSERDADAIRQVLIAATIPVALERQVEQRETEVSE